MLKRKEFILGAAVGLTFAAAATAGGVIDWPTAHAQSVSGRLVASAGANGAAFQPPPGAPMSFADIFEQVAPAVVQIEVRTRVVGGPRTVIIPGTPFQFQLPPGSGPEGEAEPEGREGAGAGSGFFISADGFIVTNNHVVENATEITVTLSDERQLTAQLVGRDEATDLAVLKVDGGPFPFVDFETSAQPRVGDWVIAVGNPFGLGGTATAGIVSAQGRDIRGANFNEFIQIDAAINTGNSGGPTFDIYGRVIGVNTAIFSPTGNSVGIGFAIPADTAKRITDRLKSGETIERGYIGVEIGTLTPDLRDAMGLPVTFKSAYVNSVTPGSPAERGGLQAGDLITALNGQRVETSPELTRLVAEASAGDILRLDVLRDGRRQTVSIRSGTRPSEAELNADSSGEEGMTPPSPATPTGVAVAGLNLAPMNAALRELYSIPPGINGLVVLSAQPGTPAARDGFLPGFVILRAGNTGVTTVADFQAAVAEARRAGREGVFVLVRTPAGNRPVVLDLPKTESEGG